MKPHKKRNKQREKNDLRKMLNRLLDHPNTEITEASATSAEVVAPNVVERTYTFTIKERFFVYMG